MSLKAILRRCQHGKWIIQFITPIHYNHTAHTIKTTATHKMLEYNLGRRKPALFENWDLNIYLKYNERFHFLERVCAKPWLKVRASQLGYMKHLTEMIFSCLFFSSDSGDDCTLIETKLTAFFKMNPKQCLENWGHETSTCSRWANNRVLLERTGFITKIELDIF